MNARLPSIIPVMAQMEADLPPNLACLKEVDALLRCPICFDLLNISMMSKCSHNFCSLCIRKFLSYKLQCPVCNMQITEQDLRNNRILDDLVTSFQAARQQLSKATFDSPPISPKTPASTVKCRTPRQQEQKGGGGGGSGSSSVMSSFFQKKPRTPPSQDAVPSRPCGQPSRRQMTSTRAANQSPPPLRPSVVKLEPLDVEMPPVQSVTPVKEEAAHCSSPAEDVKPVLKVECPVCSVSVPNQFINKHLDCCLTSGEKKESLRSSIGKTRRPMAKLVYNLLSMQELKRRLKECHLSAHGSRDQMIRRHQEFLHIYNAQCDSLSPKSAEDIAKDVEANEKIRSRLQGKTKPVMVFSKNQSEEQIDEMHSNYRKKHSSDFSRLIAQVRGRLETTRQSRTKPEAANEGEDEPATHSAEPAVESKSCPSIKVEKVEADETPCAHGMSLSPSPSFSDVSISRESETKPDKAPGRKQRSRSRGRRDSPPGGKRRRKS
ncbi:E3 ubiquitin-protein ligase RAD18 isoform X2 [Nelusetta ayraudi]|uniref:E3 ubiquitin-protein ligase RAD18 isoform X2 n=1 Tax=Nelusetta ayraudi TaxID=303726 RepID=UPI003F71289F